MRLIDADAVVLQSHKDLYDYEASLVKDYLDLFPTIEAEPVKHGRWIKHSTIHGFVYCENCKDVYLDKEWLADGKWKYCPNCGAKMDLECG